MSRYSQVNVSSIAGVNSELQKISASIDTLLDRDGTAPNQLEADVDFNSNDILNVGTINGQSLVIAGTSVGGGGGIDVSSNYNWTGAHTYTTLPTYNSFNLVTTDTIRSIAVEINAQTGTSYTTVLDDQSKLITLANASAIGVTIPPNSSIAYPVGTVLTFSQLGLGQVTITPGSGVTVNTEVGLKISAQYGFCTIIKLSTDTWLASGSLSA